MKRLVQYSAGWSFLFPAMDTIWSPLFDFVSLFSAIIQHRRHVCHSWNAWPWKT